MQKILILIIFIITINISHAHNNYVDSLKIVLSKTREPIERFNLLNKLEEEIYTTGTGENTVDYNLEMLHIAQQLNNDSLTGLAYSFAGIYYLYTKGDFNTALDYYFKGLPYSEKARDKVTLTGTYVDISNACAYLKISAQQIEFARKAEANLPEENNPQYYFMLTQVQLCYAWYYLNTSEPLLALKHTQAANESVLKINNPVFKCFVLVLFGFTYEQLGEDDLAEVYFKEAVSKSDSMQFPFINYISKDGYIGFLIEKKNYSEAKKQAIEMLRLGDQSQNSFYRLSATRHLRTIFDLQNKPDSAYYFSKQQLALQDTVFNQEKINKMHTMAFNEEFRIAEEQNKKAESEQLRKKNIQYVLIILGIITFIILFILLSRSVITNTKLIEFLGAMALLIVFEFLNLLLHPFLENFTNHTPIFMLLALVSIAAFLIPLHRKLEIWTIQKLVENNKIIRLAAAKKKVEELDKNQNKILVS